MEEYIEFIIGVDVEGKNISFTCDPEQLANNFGANPKSPHYLTPIFFDRKVLSIYYNEPSKYSIQDGYLSCGHLWGIRIDNNHKKYVIVFLGDLGRDLPTIHRKYWESFNIPPAGKMSNVEVKRSFLAEFTDPSSLDLIFKQKLSQFKNCWRKKFYWDLFKDLNDKDKFHLIALRVPMTNEQSEFDSQIQSLVKIIIDSLNESEIVKEITLEKGDKGIIKLKKFLSTKGIKNYKKHINFLIQLQSLRSTGIAHRKRSEYDEIYSKIIAKLEISPNNLSEVFKDILKLAIGFLEDLILFCESKK